MIVVRYIIILLYILNVFALDEIITPEIYMNELQNHLPNVDKFINENNLPYTFFGVGWSLKDDIYLNEKPKILVALHPSHKISSSFIELPTLETQLSNFLGISSDMISFSHHDLSIDYKINDNNNNAIFIEESNKKTTADQVNDVLQPKAFSKARHAPGIYKDQKLWSSYIRALRQTNWVENSQCDLKILRNVKRIKKFCSSGACKSFRDCENDCRDAWGMSTYIGRCGHLLSRIIQPGSLIKQGRGSGSVSWILNDKKGNRYFTTNCHVVYDGNGHLLDNVVNAKGESLIRERVIGKNLLCSFYKNGKNVDSRSLDPDVRLDVAVLKVVDPNVITSCDMANLDHKNYRYAIKSYDATPHLAHVYYRTEVMKSGATSGFTKAKIIGYGNFCHREARQYDTKDCKQMKTLGEYQYLFTHKEGEGWSYDGHHQNVTKTISVERTRDERKTEVTLHLLAQEFGQKGDSGSAIVAVKNRRSIALLHSDLRGYVVGSPVERVMEFIERKLKKKLEICNEKPSEGTLYPQFNQKTAETKLKKPTD